MCIVEIYKL